MNFEPLAPEDFPRLKPFFRRQANCLSIYSLASLIAWNNDIFQSCAAVADDSLILTGGFLDGREPPFLFMPISPDRQWFPEALHDLALNLGMEFYQFVPEDYLHRWGAYQVGGLFEIEEQTEFADYVYLTEDLAGLKGNRYSKKRNLINQFQRIYAGSGRVQVSRIEPAAVPECIDFLEQWCEERDCGADPAGDFACEKKAAATALTHAQTLEMAGILLRIDGCVSAIGLASRLTLDMGVLHFEKAFARVKGLYQYFDNQCARKLFIGTRYINKESDMNVPGLAKAKKSYYPVRMIRSYKLAVR
jgi:hypothetical protein